MGIGGAELVIIVIIGLVLFGVPVLTFLLGYTLGQRKTIDAPPAASTASDTTEESTTDE